MKKINNKLVNKNYIYIFFTCLNAFFFAVSSFPYLLVLSEPY
jgi:hypothetical protein